MFYQRTAIPCRGRKINATILKDRESAANLPARAFKNKPIRDFSERCTWAEATQFKAWQAIRVAQINDKGQRFTRTRIAFAVIIYRAYVVGVGVIACHIRRVRATRRHCDNRQKYDHDDHDDGEHCGTVHLGPFQTEWRSPIYAQFDDQTDRRAAWAPRSR
jgi:hypothetical protein